MAMCKIILEIAGSFANKAQDDKNIAKKAVYKYFAKNVRNC